MGAAHSGNRNSVMRPVLGDGRSRSRDFRILLDEPNAQIVRLISAEMAMRNVVSMHQLTVPTRVKVRDYYKVLAKDFPEDEVAKMYAGLMDRSIRLSVQRRQEALKKTKTKKATAAKQPVKELNPAERTLWLLFPIQAHVEVCSGVRQCADANAVDTRFRNFLDAIQRDTAGSFQGYHGRLLVANANTFS